MTNTANRRTEVYGNVFENINPKVIAETKKLIQSGIWDKGMSEEDKCIYMGIWVKNVSEIYGMEKPKLYFHNDKSAKRHYKLSGGGRYYPSHNEIHLYKKISLVTLLHEFRHAMQYRLKEVKIYKKHLEKDARAWSCSLYKLSAPKSYEKAVQLGILNFY